MRAEPIENRVAVIILAAGKGSRMKSQRAKVLHSVAGRPMILYVIDAAVRIAGSNIVVVIGIQAEKVKALVSAHADVEFAVQERQLGTGHAALCALPAIEDHVEHVVVLCGDVPLIKSKTLDRLVRSHISRDPAVTVLGARLDDPSGYGRIKQKADCSVERIVEQADANEEEKKINTVNTGIYCINRRFLKNALGRIGTDNAQNEMYLTDIVGIAAKAGKKIELMLCGDTSEMWGINTRDDLEKVESIILENEKP
ncbi:MAG: sugar phosphate nucleotidyltransferase [Desulfobacterales bacterium]